MFENFHFGRKLKAFAYIFGATGSILSAIYGVLYCVKYVTQQNDVTAGIINGVIIVVFGIFFSWLIALALGAFGEMTDDISRLRTIFERSMKNDR